MPERLNDVMLVDQGLVSAYGRGVACCAEGLLAGRRVLHSAGDRFPAPLADLSIAEPPMPTVDTPSPLLALIDDLFADTTAIPADAALYAATTLGEIDRLERVVHANDVFTVDDSRISCLPQRVAAMLSLYGGTMQTVSSACASSTAALAVAAAAIRRGEISCALVVAADLLSEFVLSGFAALMAIDPGGARPFDNDHRGMTVGSAAAFALLMSRERMAHENRRAFGVVAGWGMTCDANHLTGPSRDGMPLTRAAETALHMAGCPVAAVSAIAAHGTGTLYNDQMEMMALKRLFGNQPRPTFSIKGGIGHTLGAAGLAGALLALEALRRGVAPPTAGLRQAAPEAEGWVSTKATPLAPSGAALVTTSGFGGVNTALLLSLTPFAGAPLPQRGGARAHDLCQIETEVDVPPAAPPDGFAPPRNFGRFSAETRLAFHAVARALADAEFVPDAAGTLRVRGTGAPARIGILACDRDGSAVANHAYFADYVASGRTLGRGQLFAYTLPTSVAAECAIACRLTGPLLYLAEPDGGVAAAWRATRALIDDAQADAMVLLAVTPRAARAVVVTPAADASVASTLLPPALTYLVQTKD